MKAKIELEFPEIRRPVRYVTIDPTLDEAIDWLNNASNASLISVDCETRGGSITCLGFATSPSEALVIPFFDARKLHSDPTQGLYIGSYWTRSGEIQIRQAINKILSSRIPKLFQNGMYDVQYLLAEGYKLCNIAEDTMLLHHALFPEMPKSLGFLGSVYTNESAWKLLRPRGGEDFRKEDI